MKPEDWANLQVGASATLPSLGVLWTQPGTAWAGAHWRGCDALAHARAHTRTLTGAHVRAHTRSCSPSHHTAHSHTRISFTHSFPEALPWHTLLAHSHTLWYTLTYASLHTNAHTHTRPAIHINHPLYIHTNSSAACYTIHTHVSSHLQTHFTLTSGSPVPMYYYIHVALCSLLPGEHQCTSRTTELSNTRLCEHTRTPQSRSCLHAFPCVLLNSTRLSVPIYTLLFTCTRATYLCLWSPGFYQVYACLNTHTHTHTSHTQTHPHSHITRPNTHIHTSNI